MAKSVYGDLVKQGHAKSLQHAQKWARIEKGATLLQTGDLQRAVEELERVLADDPTNEYAHFFMGNALYEQALLPQALQHYCRAIEIEPSYTAALINTGHTLHRLDRNEDAVRIGKRVLAQDPNDSDGLYLMGVVSYAMGHIRQTRYYLSKFLKSKPEYELVANVSTFLEGLGGTITKTEPDQELNDLLN